MHATIYSKNPGPESWWSPLMAGSHSSRNLGSIFNSSRRTEFLGGVECEPAIQRQTLEWPKWCPWQMHRCKLELMKSCCPQPTLDCVESRENLWIRLQRCISFEAHRDYVKWSLNYSHLRKYKRVTQAWVRTPGRHAPVDLLQWIKMGAMSRYWCRIVK